MKKVGLLDEEESKKPCYIMVGQQIKYEPAWVQDHHKKANFDHRKFLEETNVNNCIKSVTQSLNLKHV